jgi:Spy/CpxP family protein refolding chaperone
MKTLIAALAAFVILIPAVSIAQQCRLLQQAEELDLTDQQIEQLQAASLANQKEMIQPRADLQKAKLELREIMQAKQINKNKALAAQKKISDIKGQMAQKRLTAKIDRLNILNDQQRAKVRKDMMLRGSRHHGRGHARHMRDCDFGPGMKGDRIEKRIMRRFHDTGGEKVIILEEEIETDEDN